MSTANDPSWYEIRIQGHLDERWDAWFDGMAVEPQPGGTTLLRGAVVDQSALHGLLTRLRDLGLPLISVVSAGVDANPGCRPGYGAGLDNGAGPTNGRSER